MAPKTRQPLPVITGRVSVSFKDEDSIHGMPIGPVIVTTQEPESRHDLGWATKQVALEIAARYGVALKES